MAVFQMINFLYNSMAENVRHFTDPETLALVNFIG
jgi:hypothetical protein